jgi:hypothetical protein
LGYTTEVVLDACRSVDTSLAAEVSLLREFSDLGVKVSLSREILPEQKRERAADYTIQP